MKDIELRDLFAIQAMQALIPITDLLDMVPERAYKMADLMLEEKTKDRLPTISYPGTGK